MAISTLFPPVLTFRVQLVKARRVSQSKKREAKTLTLRSAQTFLHLKSNGKMSPVSSVIPKAI